MAQTESGLRDIAPIGVALVGYGGIGKLHALVYRALPVAYGPACPPIRLVAICTATAASAARAAADTGVDLVTTDLDELLAHPGVHVVDCCVPTASHAAIARAALTAGKALYCEKPLAHTLASAEEIAVAAERAAVPVGVHFHFRWAPALRHARRLIEGGLLGDLYSARITYLRPSNLDVQRPMSWRFRRAEGGGVLLDLGSHVVDLALYLFGPIGHVAARLATMVPERPGAGGKLETVDVEDAAWLDVSFAGGGVATLEVSKVAAGCQDDLRLEAYGSRGALRFDAMDPHWLWVYDSRRPGSGFERLPAGDRHDPPAATPGADVIGGLPYLARRRHGRFSPLDSPGHAVQSRSYRRHGRATCAGNGPAQRTLSHLSGARVPGHVWWYVPSRSISRILCPTLTSRAVAISLGRRLPAASCDQPGGRAEPSLDEAGYARFVQPPVRSCSRWGLPRPTSHLAAGELLPRHFTLTSACRRRYVSVALSLGLPPLGVTQHPALWSSDFPHTAYAARDHPAWLRQS